MSFYQEKLIDFMEWKAQKLLNVYAIPNKDYYFDNKDALAINK